MAYRGPGFVRSNKKHWAGVWGAVDSSTYGIGARSVDFIMGSNYRFSTRRVWIYLQRYSSGRWRTYASTSAYFSSRGSLRRSFRLSGKPAGKYRILVQYAGSTKYEITYGFTVYRSSRMRGGYYV